VTIVAADSGDRPSFSGSDDTIVVQKAQDRLYELIEREQLPTDVRYTLAGALSGDLRRQQLLFQAMVDTWPRLQKCLREIRLAIRKADWKVKPWAERGTKPTPQAEKLAKEIEHDIWSMRPDVARGEKGFEGTVEELAIGYYFGHHVLETNWNRDTVGYKPRSTKVVPPRFYGYPYVSNEDDRLMFDPTGTDGTVSYVDFPDHHFLLAINGGHPGHPTVAAPLRALATYWLAAVYGLKWLTQFAQICGVPFRWAEYAVGDNTTKDAVASMLANIGSSGWGAFPSGTKVNFEDVGKGASDVAQKILMDVANDACSEFILGQNLTTSSGQHGTQALGTVHEEVRQELIKGVCDFVGEILTYQLVPSMVALNYGSGRTDLPGVWAEWSEEKDLKNEADRFNVLKGLGIRIGEEWGHEVLGVPIPAEGDKLLFPEANQLPTAPAPPVAAPPIKSQIQASDAGTAPPLTVDQLSASVLEGLTGVSREWLSTVRPAFDRLAALAMSKTVSDEDFISALEKAQRDMPELFDLLNTEALQTAFEDAIGSAALAGSVSRYEPK
jgi:phage gp29-like protein